MKTLVCIAFGLLRVKVTGFFVVVFFRIITSQCYINIFFLSNLAGMTLRAPGVTGTVTQNRKMVS
jgi:hypothetical protein